MSSEMSSYKSVEDMTVAELEAAIAFEKRIGAGSMYSGAEIERMCPVRHHLPSLMEQLRLLRNAEAGR